MIKRGILLGFMLFSWVFSTGLLKAQEWNYARMSIIYGGSIPFQFNSIQRFTEGIEVTEGTILGITLADSSQIGHDLEGFDLNFRTFNGQTVIKGEAEDLPLDRIRVKAESYLGLGSGTTYGYQDLNSTWTTLFSYTSLPFIDLVWDTHQLSISYDCGKPVSAGGNGALLGERADYYHVEIEFELVPTGPGF